MIISKRKHIRVEDGPVRIDYDTDSKSNEKDADSNEELIIVFRNANVIELHDQDVGEFLNMMARVRNFREAR